MKTNTTIKQLLLAFTMVLGMAACKKDKTDTTPAPPAEVKSMTFTELKALSTGATVKVPDAKKIKGIVISDVASKNIDSKTVILQEASDKPGIILTFDAAQTFAMNDEVEVNISNQTMAQVSGEAVLQNIPAANAKKTGTGTITAKAVTIADLKTNKATLNGTLVTIAATELTSTTGKYAGNLTITDASGTVTSTVLADAFTGMDLPVSVSAVTGIVRINNADARVDIRKTGDVAIGAITRILVEKFENITLSLFNDYYKYVNCLSNNFSTAMGNYDSGSSGVYKYPGSLYDASFTTSDRNYVYLARSRATGGFSNTAGYISPEFTNLQGVKTIKITFAGTTANKVTRYDAKKTPDEVVIEAFDPTIDKIQIGIYLRDPVPGAYPLTKNVNGVGMQLEKLFKFSPEFKKTGEFFTWTYTVPTKEEIIAAGADEETATRFLAQPNFFITNYSTRNGTISSYAPILFDKIEFGF